MSKKTSTDWLSLLENTNLNWYHNQCSMDEELRKPEAYTAEELLAYEQKIGFILPHEYKGYLQTFGPGSFGRCQFRIDTLCLDSLGVDEPCNLGKTGILDCVNPKTFSSEEQAIIDRGYLFGDSDKDYTSLFLDLDTYNSIDQDCNIYGLHTEHDGTGALYLLGRSFFEFVQDCCIGDKAFKDFPELVYKLDEMVFCDPSEDQKSTDKYWDSDLVVVNPPKMFSPFSRACKTT